MKPQYNTGLCFHIPKIVALYYIHILFLLSGTKPNPYDFLVRCIVYDYKYKDVHNFNIKKITFLKYKVLSANNIIVCLMVIIGCLIINIETLQLFLMS